MQAVINFLIDMDGPRKVHLCAYCEQELSHAAYYRHLEDETGCICPGKRMLPSSDSDSSFEFDFEDTTMETNLASATTSLCNEPYCSDETAELSDDNSEDDDDLEGEEIWESSESEDDQLQSTFVAERMLKGTAFFFTKFQLVFKISERAMTALLLFLGTVFMFLSGIIKHPLLTEICQFLPRTMWKIKNITGIHKEGVIDYVVCPKCHSLFSISDCTNYNKEFIDKLCTHIEYPKHPHRSRRSKCNSPLMKRVKISGKSKLMPRKVYQYRSIIDSLKRLTKRQNFLTSCEHWRKRAVSENMYADVYDGAVWRDLQYINGSPFLASPHNLCLMMNVDWFNPYKHSQYSAGAIYLVVMNLPRKLRYKFENILLVGLIPGPKEPALHINSYLSPLIEDLNLLFHGVTFQTPGSLLGYSTIRALLTCICSDLPATRKLCGFLSHSANLGCSKCLKKFPAQSFSDKLDYSGFDCTNWELRSNESHTNKANLVKEAVTATARTSIERKYGLRYSILLSLPNFDVVRYHTIDPMHNIFLGIAKLCIKIWKTNDILRSCHFDMIQNKVDMIIPPLNIGRIPAKISSGFASFTADEWKHWILIYSLYALHGVLPDRDYSCWLLFVKFCSKVCKSVVSRHDILSAQEILLEFCDTFQQLYGASACTPNLHMACHLKDSLLDYGPFPAFWCFSFERFNGTLEGMCKSWITPEKQMLTKFLNMQYLDSLNIQHTQLAEEDFVKLISKNPFFQPSKLHDSVEQTTVDGLDIAQQMYNHTCEVTSIDVSVHSYHSLSYPCMEKVFNDGDMQFVKEMYDTLYSSSEHKIVRISRFYTESKQLSVHGLQLISSKARSQRSSAIVAHWRNHNSGIDSTGRIPLRVGIVTSFMCHNIHVEDGLTTTCKKHFLAKVNWLQEHPKRDQYVPGVLVCCTQPELDNCSSFIPISRIAARCALIPKVNVHFDYGEDSVCVCVPLVNGILI